MDNIKIGCSSDKSVHKAADIVFFDSHFDILKDTLLGKRFFNRVIQFSTDLTR